jgi:hypothetical protein
MTQLELIFYGIVGGQEAPLYFSAFQMFWFIRR